MSALRAARCPPADPKRRHGSDDAQAEMRSSRNRPARISACRSVRRGEHARVHLDPRRSADRLHRLLWARAAPWPASSGSSPISSGKIVPPSAASNFPRRSATAPVNAPRTWPNSSPRSAPRGSPRSSLRRTRPMPPAERVDRPRDQFLAGAVLAVDQTRPLVSAAIATCSRSCRIAWLSPTIV